MHILIVEDDAGVRDFLGDSLKGEGFAVDAAEDGENGLRKAQVNQYDLVILDNHMPGMNGRELCAQLRALGKEFPILMLSVGGEAAVKTDVLNVGADDYLTKPFSFDELRARIGALLRRPKKLLQTHCMIGDVAVRFESRSARRGDASIALTCKEFSLLEYLLCNRGRVVSKGDILEHVWGGGTDPFTNTVEAHLRNLRKKLGGAADAIHTVIGVGYRVDE